VILRSERTIWLCSHRSCVIIAITTADVILQALVYDDSFEAKTLYGTTSDGKEKGRKFSGDRLTSERSAAGIHAQKLADRITGRCMSPTPAQLRRRQCRHISLSSLLKIDHWLCYAALVTVAVWSVVIVFSHAANLLACGNIISLQAKPSLWRHCRGFPRWRNCWDHPGMMTIAVLFQLQSGMLSSWDGPWEFINTVLLRTNQTAFSRIISVASAHEVW